MNGVHDLGGMQGFGPVEREENEPTFHADWEAVVLAIQHAGRQGLLFNIDEFRHGIERMAPAHYLRATYYEKWLEGITRVLIEKGVLDPQELIARRAFFERAARRAGRRGAARAAAVAGPLPAGVDDGLHPRHRGHPAFRAGRGRPHAGDAPARPHAAAALRARQARRRSTAATASTCSPTRNAHGRGEEPQPLYSVRFDARELWGESAEPNQAVHIDLWESYLLPGR